MEHILKRGLEANDFLFSIIHQVLLWRGGGSATDGRFLKACSIAREHILRTYFVQGTLCIASRTSSM